MATVDQIARDALDAVGSPEALLSAHRWVNHRYAQLVAQVRYRHLRHAGMSVIPGIETTGTLSTTTGSAVVTGTGTAWTAALVGRWAHLQTSWYEVAAVDSPTQLRLAVPYADPPLTDAPVRLAVRYLTLPPSVRFVQSFTLVRATWQPLRAISQRVLDEQVAPGRPYVTSLGGGLGVVADAGWDADTNTRRFEIWPYSIHDEAIAYVYWTAPATYEADADLPPTIDPYILKEGVLIDVFRWEAAQAARKGDMNGAAYFRNESRAQETTWQQRMREAARQDRGLDDTTFLVTSLGGWPDAAMDRADARRWATITR